MDIVLDENLGPVIEIGGQCYELIGSVDTPPDTQAVEATAIFETCDECETDTSSAAQVVEEGSSAAADSSAVADSSTDSSGISSAAAAEELNQIEDCTACDCSGHATITATITYSNPCGFCSPDVTDEVITLSRTSGCSYQYLGSGSWPGSMFLDCGTNWEVELDIQTGICKAGPDPPPSGVVVALDCTSGKPLGTVVVPVWEGIGFSHCGDMTIVFS
jgi:hypothetical protein